MKSEIKQILEEAKLAPSVLNTQPWRFRLCGNTIEVYLEKQRELHAFDPASRLQIASCGSLIAYITNAAEKSGWTVKVDYFPRFEEENLVAFVEIKDTRKKNNTEDAIINNRAQKPDEIPVSLNDLLSEMATVAASRDVNLVLHEDDADRQLQNYFEENCGRNLENVAFQEYVSLFFRSGLVEPDASIEDEVLLSDRFFQSVKTLTQDEKLPAGNQNLFLIVTTGSDNRYAWTRSGEVLANTLLLLKKTENTGLMALPVISKDSNCREWLRKELNIKGYPQFVLKMGKIRQHEHSNKRSLQELIKFGF